MLAALCLAGGCAAWAPPPEQVAEAAGLQRTQLAAGQFKLAAYTRYAKDGGILTVYIEGDGAPWRRRDAPPADPTPRESLALRLAAADTSAAVAWLARPCQYLAAKELAGCDSRYWRRARYAEEVVAAVDSALSNLLRDSGARQLVLVGHSGGGAVATLVAARRSDVSLLVTVGGVLDTVAWTALHGVTALDQSLNPADFAARLSRLRQVHFVGEQDDVTPPAIADAFAARAGHEAIVVHLSGRGHDCCWERDWISLIEPFRKDHP